LQIGTPVVWTYLVYNQAGVPLNIVDLRDSDGFMPTYVSGDVGPNGGVADGILGVEEVWLFTSAGVTGAPTTALAGQHANTVTVVAFNDDTGLRYIDDDQANYFGTSAGISIVKSINAIDPNHPTVQEDANDPLRPVTLQNGSVPTFTFQVTNLGANALKDITIVDDAVTNVIGDDFKPRPGNEGPNGTWATRIRTACSTPARLGCTPRPASTPPCCSRAPTSTSPRSPVPTS
jgi:hypothetical protein